MDESSAGQAMLRAGSRGRGGQRRGSRSRGGLLRWASVPAAVALLAGAAVAAGASGGTADAGTSLVTGAAWSGYVVRPGPYYSVSAEFTVPDGACSQGPGESGRWTGFWFGFRATAR